MKSQKRPAWKIGNEKKNGGQNENGGNRHG